MLANFAAFGQMPGIIAALGRMGFDRAYAEPDIELHFAALLVMLVLSFFAFTLSLRQFNHFCILLGALGRKGDTTDAEIDAIAGLTPSPRAISTMASAVIISPCRWSPGSSPPGSASWRRWP